MTPPPPFKLGQRDLFNDSFFSFLRRKDKSQPAPPVAGTQSPDSQAPVPIPNGTGFGNGYGRGQRGDESLGEKKALLQEGHQLLDATKDLLEMNPHILRKDTIKRFRKQAAKMTKGAPSKSKLAKKSVGELHAFQESAKTLYQEVENILREFDQHPGEYPVQPQDQQRRSMTRSRSESPPPLPRKPPSPKVTFTTEMKQDPNVHLSRKESSRRGLETSQQARAVDLTRQDSVKPPSSRQREKEADIIRSSSQREPERSRSGKYDHKDDDRYKYRDDHKRSDSYRHPSDHYRTGSVDPYKDRDKEYRPSHTRHHSDTRDYAKDYYESRSRRYDDRDRDRERSRRDERDRDGRKGESSRTGPPLRVVHEDAPLSAAHGGAGGVPFTPTYVEYPDESGRRRRDRDRERERERERDPYRERDNARDRERDKDRDRDRGDRDRDRDRRREREGYDRSYKRDDDYYKSSRGDKYKSSSRRYEDEYRSGSGRHRERERGYEYDDRDRDKRREKDRDRGVDRDRDRDRDRNRDREREKEKEKEPQLHTGDTPPLTPTDPSGSKFQEVFSPPELAGGGLPPPEEAAH